MTQLYRVGKSCVAIRPSRSRVSNIRSGCGRAESRPPSMNDISFRRNLGLAALLTALISAVACGADTNDAPAGPEDAASDAGTPDGGASPADGSVEPTPETKFPINVTITGLEGKSVTLQNNKKDSLTIALPAASGTFAQTLPSGASYDVTVAAHPAEPTQLCTVAGGSGTVGQGPVSINVTCVDAYAVGGTLNNVRGKGLVLQNNAGDDLVATGDSFRFSKPLLKGSPYAVMVSSNPTDPWQTCTVENGNGTVDGADISDVDVTCAPVSYKVKGTFVGLEGVVFLHIDHGTTSYYLPFGPGTTTFEFDANSGDTMSITIDDDHQPRSPVAQKCTVANGTGKIANHDLTGVTITCVTSSFPVKLRALDLPGSGLVVTSGADTLTVAADGDYVFPTALKSGTAYSVSVTSPPAGGAGCALYNGSGTVGSASPVVIYGCGKPKKVFVSSASYKGGELGGLAGADAKCNALAANAGLSGVFKAWLSDSVNSPATRFAQPPYQSYVLADGSTLIASSFAALTSGTLVHAIDKTETGAARGSTAVHTYTMADGTRFEGVAGVHGTCADWTDTASTDRELLGSTDSTTGGWTQGGVSSYCNSGLPIFCFEQ